MQTIGIPAKRIGFYADALLKKSLLFILTTAYVLIFFSLVVAMVVLPFGDPSAILMPPLWLQPLAGRADGMLSAFLAIIAGPTIGVNLIATVLVLLTTPSVYRWLCIGINDLIDGQHDDAFALMTNFYAHLETMTAPQAILPTIAATIAQTLKLPYVAIATHDEAVPLEVEVGVVPPGAEITALALRYQETKIGELRVAARRAGEPLSQSDRKVLSDLARQVGIALYAAQLTADLQRSRTRLVTAREEERRRLRRDLHDGLGPTLANFAMRLEQARDTLPAAAVESDTILANLTGEAQQAITDIRRLVYELRPPDLDEYGLISALREYLQRRQPKGTALTLTAPDPLPALPAAVEVAAYRIVQEAVNNAVKHARASAITVTLALPFSAELPLSLCVEICDNGVGLSADHPIGIGLHSMRERAEELGGSCVISSHAEGGTQVVAQLPLGLKN